MQNLISSSSETEPPRIVPVVGIVKPTRVLPSISELPSQSNPVSTDNLVTKRISLISDKSSMEFMANYKKIHQAVIQSPNMKVVVFRRSFTWGLGNHLVGLYSVILYALCTNRVILG
jgi:hypothetical protein